jgi:hypothetical protein
MTSNLERYRKDLGALIATGERLLLALQYDCFPDRIEAAAKKQLGAGTKKFLADLPSFVGDYQVWYSESLAVVKQLLPDRLDDFTRHYERPKSRKDLNYETYRIEDSLQGLTRKTGGGDVIVGTDAGIPHLKQQIGILLAARARLESALYDIRQLTQADLFDSELAAAEELTKNNFLRAAGAMAGVVLEKHLYHVCEAHRVAVAKKSPGISDLNDALKKADVIDVPQWRQIQHLADIRNLCDHDKKKEPTREQVADLIAGVSKVIKSVF